MKPLSLKAMKAASPTSTHPYELVRWPGPPFSDPVLYRTVTDVRSAIARDLDEIMSSTRRITETDRSEMGRLQRELAVFETGSLDAVIDEYSGTRYRVSVRDRRV